VVPEARCGAGDRGQRVDGVAKREIDRGVGQGGWTQRPKRPRRRQDTAGLIGLLLPGRRMDPPKALHQVIG